MIISAIDAFGMHAALSAHSAWATPLMRSLSAIFDPMIVLLAACLIVAYLLAKKMQFEAWRFLIGMLSISAFVWIVKHLVVRVRPLGGLIEGTGFSFPSGHASVSVVFFYILYLTIRPHVQSLALRRICFVIALAAPLLIGWSRVYLGVHYLSDILAGFIFGAIVVSFAILCSSSRERKSQ